jgi:hypothetical protein
MGTGLAMDEVHSTPDVWPGRSAPRLRYQVSGGAQVSSQGWRATPGAMSSRETTAPPGRRSVDYLSSSKGGISAPGYPPTALRAFSTDL